MNKTVSVREMLLPRFTVFKPLLKGICLRTLATQTQVQKDKLVVFEKLTGLNRGIAVYGLNSPKDRNALGFGLLEVMKEVNQILREDTKLSVVILHSLVPGIFCAGKRFH